MAFNQRARSAESISKVPSLTGLGPFGSSIRMPRGTSLSPRSSKSSARTASESSSPTSAGKGRACAPGSLTTHTAGYLQTIEHSGREFRAELMYQEATILRESVLKAQLQMIIGFANMAKHHSVKMTFEHHFRPEPAYCMVCNFAGIYELRIDGMCHNMFVCANCINMLKHVHG
jgi:hypothetical protein